MNTLPAPFALRLRWASVLSALVLFVGLVASVPLLSATPAHAEDPPPCDICGGSPGGGVGNTNPTPTPTPTPTPGGGTPGDGGGAPGGSGGAVTPGTWSWGGTVWQPTNPPTPIGGDGFRGKVWSPTTNTYHYNNKCEGTAWTGPDGRRFGYLGTKWSLSGTAVPAYTDPENGFEIPDTYTATAGGYECIDPPKYRIYQWDCLLGGSASYTGPMHNGENPAKPEKHVELDSQDSEFVLDGKTSPTLCVKAERYDWTVNGLKDWGEYYLNTSAHMQKCDYYDWYTVNERTGRYNDDYIDCSGGQKYDINPSTDKLELFCPPPSRHKPTGDFHSNHDYSAQDCKAPPSGANQPFEWTCGPVPTPVFNGRSSPTGSFQVLDDAKERRLKYDRPAISGAVDNIRNQTVRLGLGGNVSPYRAGEVPNSDRQPFKVVPDVDMWKHGWQQAMPDTNNTETGWDMAFMAPGVPGKPFTLTPTWAFRAEFLSKRVSEVRIDPQTNEWRLTMEDYWYTSDETCTGAPVDLNVYRARNSQGR